MKASIDVLPMAAIGLILLLAMMIIAPMTIAHTDIPIAVPQTRTAERKVEENVTISYTLGRKLFIDDRPVAGLAELESGLAPRIARDPSVTVVIRADKDVLHHEVLDILAMARRAGAVRIVCATKHVGEE